jgi:hypothetical protein
VRIGEPTAINFRGEEVASETAVSVSDPVDYLGSGDATLAGDPGKGLRLRVGEDQKLQIIPESLARLGRVR